MIDAVHVSCGHGRGAVGGVKGGEAETKHDGVATRDADWLGEIVNAGSEEQVLAFGKLRIDGGGGVFVGSSDVEVSQRDRSAGRGAGAPGDALTVGCSAGTRTLQFPFASTSRKVFRARREFCRPWCRAAAATRLQVGAGCRRRPCSSWRRSNCPTRCCARSTVAAGLRRRCRR